MIAPKEESVTLVKEWLAKDIPDAEVTVKGDYVSVQAKVKSIEKLLKTEYRSYGESIHPVSYVANIRSQRRHQDEEAAHASIQSS